MSKKTNPERMAAKKLERAARGDRVQSEAAAWRERQARRKAEREQAFARPARLVDRDLDAMVTSVLLHAALGGMRGRLKPL